MASFNSTRLRRAFLLFACVATLVLVAAAVAGHFLDVAILRGSIFGLPAMRPLTMAMLAVISVGYGVSSLVRSIRIRRAVSVAAGSLAVAVGVASIIAATGGLTAPNAASAIFMSPQAALAFVLLGAAIVTLYRRRPFSYAGAS